jgi:hypothetical protein
VLLAQVLLFWCVALGADKPASCELANKNIISRDSSGIGQVSNLADIEITCRVPARSLPTRPGESRYGLTAASAAYILSDRGKKLVPSEVLPIGGGRSGPGLETEWVDFYLHIPLEPAERDIEARRYLAQLEKSIAPDQITDKSHQQVLDRIRELVYQHRVGRFQVECRVFDGNRVMGVGIVEVEVLFKGRFSDVGFRAAPPA